MIRYLIWDVDGTLFDTYPAFIRAFRAALNDFGESVPLERIEDLARISLSHCASTLADELGLNSEDLIHKFGQHYRNIPQQEQSPFPGVVDICEYICSIGGLNLIVTHRARESTDRFLATHNMTRYFADTVAGDDDYPRKPNPAAFEAIINKHKLKRTETLTIGDRDIDILAGQAAGVRTCFFGGELDGVTADFMITDYTELHQLIASENSVQ
jgi:phosphoglycolate phosphatase-like HAD superfamily hydrolase